MYACDCTCGALHLGDSRLQSKVFGCQTRRKLLIRAQVLGLRPKRFLEEVVIGKRPARPAPLFIPFYIHCLHLNTAENGRISLYTFLACNGLQRIKIRNARTRTQRSMTAAAMRGEVTST